MKRGIESADTGIAVGLILGVPINSIALGLCLGINFASAISKKE